MRLLNFNEKKKNPLFVKKKGRLPNLTLSSWGYTSLLIPLILGGKKKSALITGIITFIFLKLNFGYTEEMAWGGMENTVWND